MASDLEDGLRNALKANPRFRSLEASTVAFAHTVTRVNPKIGLSPPPSGAINAAFKGVRVVHSLCFFVTHDSDRVMFFGDFDPPIHDALALVLARCATPLDAAWAHCKGYPAAGMSKPEAFVKFLALGYEPVGFHYRAYSNATVDQVCRALDWRRKTMRFQVELAKAPRHGE
ncbi:MAG: hypothetical protein AAF493_10070 [Pseudomonadota bacterium]